MSSRFDTATREEDDASILPGALSPSFFSHLESVPSEAVTMSEVARFQRYRSRVKCYSEQNADSNQTYTGVFSDDLVHLETVCILLEKKARDAKRAIAAMLRVA